MNPDDFEAELANLGLILPYKRACAKRHLCKGMGRPEMQEMLYFVSRSVGASISEEELQKVAEIKGMSQEQLLAYASLEINFLKWCESNYEGKVNSIFIQKKRDFTRLSYSLIRVKDRNLAWEIFHRLEARESNFVELASKFSEGNESLAGGYIGEAEAIDIVDSIANKLLTMKDGEVSSPFEVEEFWVLIRLNKSKKPSLDKALKRRIVQECGEEYLEEVVKGGQ